jgi:type II secretory pathway component PulJ
MSMLSAAALWLHLQWQSDRQIRLRSHTQQDLRALMDTLIHDLRRANFQALMPNNLTGNSGACPSAFCGLPEDFEISSHQVLFSIDRNSNGIKDNNECSGFRMNGKELQTKTACQPVVWSTLSDAKNLQILSLDFSIECDNSSSSSGDVVAVSLSAQSTSEKVPQTWQRWVRLRNHNARTRSTEFNCNLGH